MPNAIARGSIDALLARADAVAVRVAGANLLAFLTGLAIVAAWPTWSILFALAAYVLMVCWLIDWPKVFDEYSAAPTGLWVVPHAVFIISISILAVRHDAQLVLWLALVAMTLAAVSEGPIRLMAAKAYPALINYPGLSARAGGRLPSSAMFFVNSVVLGIIALSSTTDLSDGVALLAGGAALVFASTVLIDLAFVVRDRQRIESRLHRLLTDYQPAFAVHWHAAGGTDYQIGMWLPYLERLGEPFIVIVRTRTNLAEARQLTTAPIVLRRALEDLDDVVVPSLKIVFFVNNATKNCHMIPYRHLTHIQLNHGDSDKAPSFNPMFRMYDLDFVAGRAAIDRFADHGVPVPESMFAIVGRPQVENIGIAHGSIADVVSPVVLYAPTWSGFYDDTNYSSLLVGLEMIAALLKRGCTVVFRPHPYARRTPRFKKECERIIAALAADRAATGRAHIFGAEAESVMSVVDCFNAADMLLSDVSSVVADFLYSQKPFAMVSAAVPAEQFVDDVPMARAAYVVDGFGGKLTGFDDVLDEMLGADPLESVRRELKAYYLGDFPADGYADHFLREARKYL